MTVCARVVHASSSPVYKRHADPVVRRSDIRSAGGVQNNTTCHDVCRRTEFDSVAGRAGLAAPGRAAEIRAIPGPRRRAESVSSVGIPAWPSGAYDAATRFGHTAITTFGLCDGWQRHDHHIAPAVLDVPEIADELGRAGFGPVHVHYRGSRPAWTATSASGACSSPQRRGGLQPAIHLCSHVGQAFRPACARRFAGLSPASRNGCSGNTRERWVLAA